MKKIIVNLSQVGSDIITQSSVSIKVNGKFVKNKLEDIIRNCIEINNDSVRVSFSTNSYGGVNIFLKFQNGNEKKFYINKDSVFNDINLSIDHTNINIKDKINDSLIRLKEEIETIEKYVFNNSSVCNNYTFQI